MPEWGFQHRAAFGCGGSHLRGSAGVSFSERDSEQASSLEAFPLRGLEFICPLSPWVGLGLVAKIVVGVLLKLSRSL